MRTGHLAPCVGAASVGSATAVGVRSLLPGLAPGMDRAAVLEPSRYDVNRRIGPPNRSRAIAKSTSNSKSSRAVRLQYGALPYRLRAQGELELLLVTSRTRGRWIIPKGWPIKGLKSQKSAAREAFEEAGVRGAVTTKPIGRYSYDKISDDESGVIPCEILVFALNVKRQLKDWPEACGTEARWVTPGDAIALVEEDGLRSLVETFAETARRGTAARRTQGQSSKRLVAPCPRSRSPPRAQK